MSCCIAERAITMKRLCSQIICLLAISGLSSAAEWVNLTDSPEVYDVKVVESKDVRTVLRYTVNRYGFDQVNIDGKVYSLLQKPGRVRRL